jgi:hypothetical protein
MVLSGILMEFEFMLAILFAAAYPHLFLFTMELGELAFIVVIILLSISIIIKIIKNKKTRKIS